MAKAKFVKLVVFVPVSHAQRLREAIGKAGAGALGNYSLCSFSTKGIGRFKPETGAHPAIGRVGRAQKAQEERIEATCQRARLKNIVQAIKNVHPYEEVVLDIYPLEIL